MFIYALGSGICISTGATSSDSASSNSMASSALVVPIQSVTDVLEVVATPLVTGEAGIHNFTNPYFLLIILTYNIPYHLLFFTGGSSAVFTAVEFPERGLPHAHSFSGEPATAVGPVPALAPVPASTTPAPASAPGLGPASKKPRASK